MGPIRSVQKPTDSSRKALSTSAFTSAAIRLRRANASVVEAVRMLDITRQKVGDSPVRSRTDIHLDNRYVVRWRCGILVAMTFP